MKEEVGGVWRLRKGVRSGVSKSRPMPNVEEGGYARGVEHVVSLLILYKAVISRQNISQLQKVIEFHGVCHTAMSLRYELLIRESVWIDNVELEREKLKQLVNVNVYLRSEP